MEKEKQVAIDLTYEEFHTKCSEYQDQIDKLRLDGSDKVKKLNYDIRSIKSNKKIKKEDKASLIEQNKNSLQEAKAVREANKTQINEIVKEATEFANVNYKQFHDAKKLEAQELKANAKATYLAKVEEINTTIDAKLNQFTADSEVKLQEEDPEKLKEIKTDIKDGRRNIINERKQLLAEAKTLYNDSCTKAKDSVHASYRHLQHIIARFKDGKLNPIEITKNKFEKYAYNFNIGKFLMKNGLFIIIFIFIIISLCLNPNLLSINHLLLILKNFSNRVFFALGVAGLILLGGTDLSIGRIITFCTMITCALLNPTSDVVFFNKFSISGMYNAVGPTGSIIIALLLSLLFAVLFSMLSGFLTAKFKMHPFISTLGTSLIVWGLIAYSTNNTKTGTITSEALKVSADLGNTSISSVLLYAIVAILIVWFIWNKTKFGKNMYAVGGNQEAASVSGISVFWVTMGVFIMAGILYGFGAFFQATTTGSSSSSLGQGWELEAIAACVIGGISFSGGIGRISGAVFGCLLFETMKYLLRAITNGNVDISNIFIGVIILVAVTFDSVKYLKKK